MNDTQAPADEARGVSVNALRQTVSARSHRILLAVAETIFALTLFALMLAGLTWFLVLLAGNVASLPSDSAFPDEAPAVATPP